MQAQCSEQPVLANALPSEAQHKAGHVLYQGAIVMAILLFLLSFWSC
jgi:hypothetical protein